MQKVDIKKLKKSFSEKADSFVKSAQENLPENLKNVDVASSMKDMARKGSQAVARFAKESRRTDKDADKALEGEEKEVMLTVEDTLKIIYFLMAADRLVDQEEMEKFDAIGRDLDPAFDEHKSDFAAFCQNEILKADEEEDYFDNIRDCIADAVRNSESAVNGTVHKTLLVWNLLATAYSDGDYSDEERKLIRFVGRRLEIDKAIIAELESAINTLVAIEKEKTFLRESDRRYTEVEAHMNELEDRVNVIMRGVHNLITGG